MAYPTPTGDFMSETKKKLTFIHFGAANKNQFTFKDRSKRTRTGAYTTGKIRAHGNHHKHN